MPRNIETRQTRLSLPDESGEFEGYIAVWDTVDSYNSEFVRGSFKKTIEERSSKIKVLYNHERLIGRAVEVREDDHGVYARGRINLDLEIGRDVHALIRGGDLDGLSFAFQVFSDDYEKGGKRMIKEVRLLEFGPVDFPANDKALITGVRAERLEDVCFRETDYTKTYKALLSSVNGELLMDAFTWTAWDILGDDGIADKEQAITAAAVLFGKAWWKHLSSLASAGKRALAASEVRAAGGPTEIARRTSLTEEDVFRAVCGKVVVASLSGLGENIEKLQVQARQSAVDTLLAVMGDLEDSERARIRSSLGADKSRHHLSSIWTNNF